MGQKSTDGVDQTFIASTEEESGVRTKAKSSLRYVQGGGSLIFLFFRRQVRYCFDSAGF